MTGLFTVVHIVCITNNSSVHDRTYYSIRRIVTIVNNEYLFLSYVGTGSVAIEPRLPLPCCPLTCWMSAPCRFCVMNTFVQSSPKVLLVVDDDENAKKSYYQYYMNRVVSIHNNNQV